MRLQCRDKSSGFGGEAERSRGTAPSELDPSPAQCLSHIKEKLTEEGGNNTLSALLNSPDKIVASWAGGAPKLVPEQAVGAGHGRAAPRTPTSSGAHPEHHVGAG